MTLETSIYMGQPSQPARRRVSGDWCRSHGRVCRSLGGYIGKTYNGILYSTS